MCNQSQNGCSVRVISSNNLALTPTIIALGKFDGVHRGHKRVIEPILPTSKAFQDNKSRFLQEQHREQHIYSTVVTFNPHPQEYFTGKPRALLTPLDEKVEELHLCGVEQLVLLPFDQFLSTLSPKEFVEIILIEQLQATCISVGQDFRFGSGRQGTAQDLQAIASQYNIPVTIVPLEMSDEDHSEKMNISTSLIRQLLETGEIQQANILLGRPYTLTGKVVLGQQIGRTIGFPTANLELPVKKFIPSKGVYAVRVVVCDRKDNDMATSNFGDDPKEVMRSVYTQNVEKNLENFYPGVMNIGNRPTVNGNNLSVEVHLLNWSGDLYNKTLIVELIKFLRPEQKFSSLEALKTQIAKDCLSAKAFFGCEF
ncbi:MAG: bifunctional riboflavin kinase/FAD synthetase [Cyanobacteria bacterium P01_A01_bin.84]